MSMVEKIDINKVKITFSVDAKRFEEGMVHSYNKNKKAIDIQGFRKGKAPRKMIENQYGKEIFYDDAINFVLPDAYENAVKENDLDVVSKPDIDVLELNDEGIKFTAEFYVKPEVVVTNYKGLTYTEVSAEPTDEEINAELDKERQKNARIIPITDRPIQNGDVVTIDFKGFMDDVAFEGGEGKDFELEIGSHSFIDNFEEQLIGSNVGDDIKVNVTFPAEYGQADLAGKPALFEVEIKDIKAKELPELNDEFIQDTTEFESLDEYKNEIVGRLIVAKQEQVKNAKQEELLTQLVDSTQMDVPVSMIEMDIDNKVNEFANNISRQGLSLDMYLQYMGQTMESMREAYRAMSDKQVKSRLILDAIAKNEDFTITDDEIDAEVERIAKAYSMEIDKLKEVLRDEDKKNLINDLKVQKALELVVENAVVNA